MAFRIVVCAAGILLAQIASGRAEDSAEGAAKPPEYEPLRYNEDYSYLREPAKRSDIWDPIKFIPLNDDGTWYLSLGGAFRERYEFYNNYRWNPEPPSGGGYLLQRYLLHAGLHFGEWFRVFSQLQSSLEDWRNGGPRPTDENRLDVHQLFADLRLPLDQNDPNDFTLRVGRQEMSYGSQRLISVRESPNIRRAFDAVRLLTRFGDLHIDAFFARPVEDAVGVFDDSGEDHINFWGVYATGPLIEGATLDLYYLGLKQPNAEFVQGTADEQRHSAGARLAGKRAAWDYNFEGVFQWGTFGSGDILAWTFASDTGYTFEDTTFTPRIGSHADVISGDTKRSDKNLGTFNALFPKGAYFGEIALIGPANLFDVHPRLDLHATKSVTITVDWDMFWRYSTNDGIYGSGGNVLRGADGSARFIGHQPSVGLEWQIERHTTFNGVYSHFFAGDYIKKSGPELDVDFVGTWIQYKF
ncbi:MAG: alginate export family protein [Gammaproteobacteria bacterium]